MADVAVKVIAANNIRHAVGVVSVMPTAKITNHRVTADEFSGISVSQLETDLTARFDDDCYYEES